MSKFLFFISLFFVGIAQAKVAPKISAENDPEHQAMFKKMRYRPIIGDKGMVVSSSREAAEYGVKILNEGGNAIDAAVATAFAMSVTRPENSSLGGGGFLVYCKNGEAQCHIIDYRETAPSRASRDMYVKDGKADTKLAQDGPLASGTPGVVAGLLTALEKWGTKSRQHLLKYPIQLAERGFPIDGRSQEWLDVRWSSFNDAAKKILSCGNGSAKVPTPCQVGQRFQQKDLAKVLSAVSQNGKQGFYQGWVAEKIAKGFQGAGGILSLTDLKHYRAAERVPLVGSFNGFQIVTMPPPSAGGANLLAMFEYAEMAKAKGEFDRGFASYQSIHALAHGMSLAFADRAQYFGDADHAQVPIQGLIAREYLAQRWKSFNDGRAHIPDGPGKLPSESSETTHFSIMDKDGNAVGITTTINYPFGSGFVPPGTGVVMNDEMDDFSAQPGSANVYGLVQGEANSIQPKKRPLSSMTPTIVRDSNHHNRIVIGAAGGPKITTSVFLNLFNRLVFEMPLPDAVAAPRFHHQWKPQTLQLESGFSSDTRDKLQSMGWQIDDQSSSGRNHAIERFPLSGRVWGVADPRGPGVGVAQ